jgi:hypothetical protein
MELPKQVWFDTVEVRYHKIILGDNPSVSEGVPITIHWEHHHREVVPVDVFESKDRTSCRVRTTSNVTALIMGMTKKENKLRISLRDRAVILLASGYSLIDLGNATYSVQEIQQERLKSAQTMKWTDNINAVLEGSGKAFKRVIRLELGGAGGPSKRNPVTPAA